MDYGITGLSGIDTSDPTPKFNKLKFDNNEVLRINVPDPDTVAVYFVHSMRSAPPLEVEGDNGRKRKVWSQESFKGSIICTGDPGTVANNSFTGDPANCPACAAISSGFVERPRATYAMNVIRYNTQPGTYNPKSASVEVAVWRHADKAKIQPLKMVADTGVSVADVDFAIAVDGSQFKKLTISNMPGKTLFESNEAIAKSYEDAKQQLYSRDILTEACGRKLTPDELAKEIQANITSYKLSVQPETSTQSNSGDLSSFAASMQNTTQDVDITKKTSAQDLNPVSNDTVDFSAISNSTANLGDLFS